MAGADGGARGARLGIVWHCWYRHWRTCGVGFSAAFQLPSSKRMCLAWTRACCTVP